jgi:hypothetical protein
MNVKLQTSKSSKIWSKRKVFSLSILGDSQRWWYQSYSDEALKLVNLVSCDCDSHYTKTTIFLCVHTWKHLKGFLLRAWNLLLKIKRLKNLTLTSKFCKNHLWVYCKTTIAKLAKDRTCSYWNLFKTLSFWSKSQTLINHWLNPLKKLAKPYKYLGK